MKCKIIPRIFYCHKIKHNERNNPYHFFRTNQWKVNHKSHSLTQFDLTMNGSDWHIVAGNDKRIVLHCLIQVSGSLFTSFSALQLQFNHLDDSSKSKRGTFNENSCPSWINYEFHYKETSAKKKVERFNSDYEMMTAVSLSFCSCSCIP